MGNANKPIHFQASTLLHQVDNSLLFLTKWKKPAINSIYTRFMKFFPTRTHLSQHEFVKLAAKSPLELYSTEIINAFAHVNNTINMLELLSVIITYSELDWENKVLLLFQVFDFDKSKSFTQDEVIILSKCFFRGIQTATKNRFQIPFNLETFANQECYFPEINSSEEILLPNIIKWVQEQKALVQLLSLYTSNDNEEKSTHRFLSRTFDRRNIEKKRKSSLSFGETPRFLNKEPGKREFAELFLAACNRMKKAQAGTLYACMYKNPMMKKDAEMFFKMYHLRLKTELSLQDFLDSASKIMDIRKLSKNQKHVEIQRKKTRRTSFDLVTNCLFPYEVLVRLFQKYDRNGDGLIDLEELKFALREVMTKAGIEDLFHTSDTDHNQVLDLKEFLKLFQRSQSNA